MAYVTNEIRLVQKVKESPLVSGDKKIAVLGASGKIKARQGKLQSGR